MLNTILHYSDNANGNTKPNDSATLEFMKDTFTTHYNNNRQPIGLYTHPIHLSVRVVSLKIVFSVTH